MKLTICAYLVAVIVCCSFQCRDSSSLGPFVTDGPVVNALKNGVIDEASGLADSYSHPGHVWVHEDSQRPPELYLINHNGTIAKKVFIAGVTNRDWEEMAVANGPEAGKKYVYIGETGDNDQVYGDYFVYRFAEPSSSTDTVFQVDKIQFKYPDGSHDCEAFFVEAATRDIYLVTKRDAFSKVYRLSYPQSSTAMNTAVFVTDLTYSGVVAAAYEADRKELLVKRYSTIYYHKQSSGQSIADLLRMSFLNIPYQQEPQGEAVCFANDGTGIFTISEKAFAPTVNLNFYRRK